MRFPTFLCLALSAPVCSVLAADAAVPAPVRLERHRILQGPLGGFDASTFPLMAGPGIVRAELRNATGRAISGRLTAAVAPASITPAAAVVTPPINSAPLSLAAGTIISADVAFAVPAAAGYDLAVSFEPDDGPRIPLLVHRGAQPRGPAMPIGSPASIKLMEGLRTPEEPLVPYPAPPDAASRQRHFPERNSDAGLAALCRDFSRILHLDSPGLEDFKRHHERGDHRAALAAYRTYFFAKLAEPERYGCPTKNLLFHFAHGRTREQLLKRPAPEVVALNLRGIAVAEIEVPDFDGRGGRKACVGAEVGPPGRVWWAPAEKPLPPGEAFDMFGMRTAGESAFWRSTEGRQLHARFEIARALRYLPHLGSGWSTGGMFYPLLGSYLTGGDRAHLERWSEYFDDYALHAQADYARSPVSLRLSTELETQQLQSTLTVLRLTLDTRPELATDFPAATLARLVTILARDYMAQLIRTRRAEMANWGIMGISYGIQVAEFFPEMKAFDYWRRELWRLWRYNMIQHRLLDGETYESFDAGHKGIDVEYAWYALPYVSLPRDADPLTAHAFWDHQRAMQRSLLVHLSPLGNYWPGNLRPWDKSWDAQRPPPAGLLKGYLGDHWLNYRMVDDVRNEPEAAWRIGRMLQNAAPRATGSAGALERDPAVPPRSTILPYAATAYLRDSWAPDAPFLTIRAFQDHSQTHPLAANFTLHARDATLLSGTPVLVDRKPPNLMLGLNKMPTVGKVDFSGQAGRHVLDTRQHASARFDLLETRNESPYGFYGYTDLLLPVATEQIGHRHKGGRDTRDRLPVVTGVSTRRQQIYVQGEKLVIIHDAIENRSETKRTFGQVFAVAAQRPNLADPAQRLIATANPDRANTSLRFFGRDVTFGGAITADASRFQPLTLESKTGINLVSVEWTGAPRHSAATLINLLPPLTAPAERTRHDLRDVSELRTPVGAAGFSATTARGARVWFVAGPAAKQSLAAGPCSTEGELLLAIERAGELSGIVLGGRSVTIDGQSHRGPAADFEFQRDAAGRFAAQPIHRPIDTVEISPAQTEFIDTLSVSFAIPTQDARDIDFRYTTDGTDPTLASQLYRGPLAVSESTYLKVRPFRRGLQQTPWNVPGTDVGKTVSAHFRRVAPQPAAAVAKTKPGLRHRYLEGDWMELMAYAGVPGVLDAKREGASSALFDASELAGLRATDGGYAVVYEGFIEVPREGVYQFHAPEHLYTAERDAGYDLRVFVGGREWMPNPDLHAENIWSVTLAAGLHRFKAAYVDYRVRPFRNDFWMAWWPEQIHPGTPVLEVSGPQLPKQPLPRNWLRYTAE